MSDHLTNKCFHCGGSFQYDPDGFVETSRSDILVYGQEVGCPHCGKSTPLYCDLKTQKPSQPASVSKPVGNLFPCPDCNHEISRHALSCPHCGRPFVQNSTTSSAIPNTGGSDMLGCLLFIALFFLIMFLMKGCSFL